MVKFKTKPDAIASMMEESVSHLPDATMAFFTLVSSNPAGRAKQLEKLSKYETDADERYIRLIRKVTDTFITPFDREDIYQMLETLDDVFDNLEHVATLVVEFELEELPQDLVNNAKLLVGMSEQVNEMLAYIKRPKKLEKALFAINEYENQLDVGHRKIICGALTPGSDPIVALKLKILTDGVEHIATRIEKFTRMLSVTAIKET